MHPAVLETSCDENFFNATRRPGGARLAVTLSLAIVQAVLLLFGVCCNTIGYLALRSSPLSADLASQFRALVIGDQFFMLFNLMDTVIHLVENLGPMRSPAPLLVVAWSHPIVWALRTSVFSFHSWTMALLSLIKCIKVAQPWRRRRQPRMMRLLTAATLAYSFVSNCPAIALFTNFSVSYMALCDDGYRLASKAFLTRDANGTEDLTVEAIASPIFLAVNVTALPVLLTLLCNLITLWRLHERSGGGVLGGPGSGRVMLALLQQRSAQATRTILVRTNTFLAFQVPVLMWTLFDTWFWARLEPSTFSCLVVVSNTLSQAFFATSFLVCVRCDRGLRRRFVQSAAACAPSVCSGRNKSPQRLPMTTNGRLATDVRARI